MIKGHTKIELVDSVTGEKNTFEEDNMVTNGFSNFFKTFGYAKKPAGCDDYNLSEKTAFAYSCFRGLMLFDNVLVEDANNLTIPSDVNCVGYGSDVSNSSINNKCGSHNQSESGVLEDGSYKFVWDFATNQANGTISSVCLVPQFAGRMGWQTTAEEYTSGINFGKTLSLGNVVKYDALTALFDSVLYFDDDYLYCIKKYNLAYGNNSLHISRTGKLVINKVRYTNKHAGIKSSYSGVLLEEVIEIPLPDAFVSRLSGSNYYSTACFYEDGYIYLFCDKSYYINPDGKFYICKINCLDFSTQLLEITNTTGVIIGFNQFSDSNYCLANSGVMSITNGKILVRTSSSPYYGYIIDMYDNTNVKQVLLGDTENKLQVYYFGCTFGSYVFCSSGTTSSSNETSACGMIYMVNVDTGKAYKVNAGSYQNALIPIFGSNYSYYYMNSYAKHKENKMFMICTFNKRDHFLFMFPFILMTINNLASPVTKTSAQTMKVTYTLTEVS